MRAKGHANLVLMITLDIDRGERTAFVSHGCELFVDFGSLYLCELHWPPVLDGKVTREISN